ncbi:MAG: hypothetical protein KJP13_04105 [Altererythrobacter sp.]|nr:hypothetical protein [Altererythrobacter sp.]
MFNLDPPAIDIAMAPGAAKTYTCDHAILEDGSVAFACSGDVGAWRWLALPPTHPIFIQTFNYYISVECSAARGTLDPSKWSALTWMSWEIGKAGAGIPVRGIMGNRADGEKIGFGIDLFDAEERLVYRTAGRGVVFQNRNFEGWRSKAKKELDAEKQPPPFTFAPREAVGALDSEHALIAPLDEGATETPALITNANGMPPGSRFLDGSGDHVNAVHLAEVGRQFCALLTGKHDLTLTGGEISFTRYVEMNVPFSIALTNRDEETIEMVIEQAGKPCTSIIYRPAKDRA